MRRTFVNLRDRSTIISVFADTSVKLFLPHRGRNTHPYSEFDGAMLRSVVTSFHPQIMLSADPGPDAVSCCHCVVYSCRTVDDVCWY